MNYQIIIL